MVTRTEPARLRLPIVGRRLLLRSPEPKDAAAIARALRDRKVTRPIGLPARYTIYDAREFIRRCKEGLKNGSKCNLSVILRGSEELSVDAVSTRSGWTTGMLTSDTGLPALTGGRDTLRRRRP